MIETPREHKTGQPPRAAAPGAPPTVERLMRHNLALAVGRGFVGRCPRCGAGALFRSYLRVNPRCPACEEDLSAERADDAPTFVTLLIVCFLGGAGALFSDAASPQMSLLATALLWLIVTAVASLLILPRVKGAVIGFQWALRMHGFDASRASAERTSADARRR